MVLENLIPAATVEKKPVEMLPLAFLYSTIALFIGLWIFPNYAGLTVVFFTIMAILPLMLRVISLEERKIFMKPIGLPHKEAMPFFVFLFLGLIISFTLWFVAFPKPLVTNLFSVQISTINQINSDIVGNYIGGYFSAIVFNNLKVLMFVLLFSFIYGAGAIFILTWNASVIAVAIGNTIRSGIASASGLAGFAGATVYFSAFSLGMLRYLTHGIPEILGYFVGGLAGGMISVAVIKHDFGSPEFNKVMLDSSMLVGFSIGMLIIAGLLEVFVSPLIPA